MTTTKTVLVPADPDQEDCLTHAVEQYLASHPECVGWDLSPRWGDDCRETVALDVPVEE